MNHMLEIEVAEEYKEMFYGYIRQSVISTFSATRLNENDQEYMGKFVDVQIVQDATKYMEKVINYLPNDEWKDFFIYYGCKFSEYTNENGKKVWDFIQ